MAHASSVLDNRSHRRGPEPTAARPRPGNVSVKQLLKGTELLRIRIAGTHLREGFLRNGAIGFGRLASAPR